MGGAITTVKPLTGQAVVNNGGTALGAGSAGTKMDQLSISNNAYVTPWNHVVQAVSPVASGDLGTIKPYSSGKFGSMEEGYYIMRNYMSRLASTNNTLLRCPGSETASRKFANYGRGNHRYHITSWDYVTGAATKGGNAGDSFTYHDPVNDTAITQEPFPTMAVPGELCYMVTGTTPTQDDYAAVYGT